MCPSKRSSWARHIDSCLKAPMAKSPEEWMNNPNRLDLPNVDTNKPKKEKLKQFVERMEKNHCPASTILVFLCRAQRKRKNYFRLWSRIELPLRPLSRHMIMAITPLMKVITSCTTKLEKSILLRKRFLLQPRHLSQ